MLPRAAALGFAACMAVALLERSADAKSAIYELRARCPCAGPTLRTFWSSIDDRMACIDRVFGELASEGWSLPAEIIARDRAREERSRCGDVRLQCDGTSARQCPRRLVCDVIDANCRPEGATGTCVSRKTRQRSCRTDPSAMCGCDGKTYASECGLRRAGVTLAHGGSCAIGCGGPDHIACRPTEYCVAFTACDGADAWGICVGMGSGCIVDPASRPVCGCDGRTYASRCEIAAAGVASAADGPCAGP